MSHWRGLSAPMLPAHGFDSMLVGTSLPRQLLADCGLLLMNSVHPPVNRLPPCAWWTICWTSATSRAASSNCGGMDLCSSTCCQTPWRARAPPPSARGHELTVEIGPGADELQVETPTAWRRFSRTCSPTARSTRTGADVSDSRCIVMATRQSSRSRTTGSDSATVARSRVRDGLPGALARGARRRRPWHWFVARANACSDARRISRCIQRGPGEG